LYIFLIIFVFTQISPAPVDNFIQSMLLLRMLLKTLFVIPQSRSTVMSWPG